MKIGFRFICGSLACVSPSLACADVSILGAEDVHDIRCAWAFQIATDSLSKDDASKPYMMNGKYWFMGRIDGRHPGFGVQTEILKRQFSGETPPNINELKACVATMSGVIEKDLKGE